MMLKEYKAELEDIFAADKQVRPGPTSPLAMLTDRFCFCGIENEACTGFRSNYTDELLREHVFSEPRHPGRYSKR
jgi:hypothetical protein